MPPLPSKNAKVDIIYFSWTGNTKKVVEIISQELQDSIEVNVIEIKPKTNYPYFVWLLLSFIPGLGTAIRCEGTTSDLILICMPKWTFNCPPITSFLKAVQLKGKVAYLVITYGGWDEMRYAESYRNKIGQLCEEVRDVLLVKRSRIASEEGKIRNWVKDMIGNLGER